MGYAQEKKNFDLGFYGGTRVSWMTSNHRDIETDGSIAGYKFGLLADYYFTNNYSFTTGLLMNSAGGKLNYNHSDMEMIIGGEVESVYGKTITFRANYVELPISLKLRTNDFGRQLFFGQFGFDTQFRTSAKDKNGFDLSEEMSLLNFGYHIGMGMEYFLSGSTSLNVALLYYNGLTDVVKDDYKKGDIARIKSVELKVGIIF